MMKRVVRILACAAVMATLSGPSVLAGPYGDELSKCLVSATTEKDKTDLVRWLFAAAALHPDVSTTASVSEKQRTEMTRSVGQLIERLLTESCRTQFRDAMQNEGNEALPLSFSVLGQVAMRRLMEHPDVAKGLGELETFINREKVSAVVQPDEP